MAPKFFMKYVMPFLEAYACTIIAIAAGRLSKKYNGISLLICFITLWRLFYLSAKKERVIWKLMLSGKTIN